MSSDPERYQPIKGLLDSAHRKEKRQRTYKEGWAKAQAHLDTRTNAERKSIEDYLQGATDDDRREWLRSLGS